MRFVRFALGAAVVLLAAGVALAQSGGLTVVVTDDTGMPLPGATVTLGSDRGNVKATASMTNVDGEAAFPVLTPGQGYWVEVSFPGFAPLKQDQLKVSVGANQMIRIQMLPEMQERIKVIAEKDVIDLETTEQVTKFSDEFISDLPVPGRSYTNVITMAPGVQDADGDGNPNVHGSRNRDFSAIVGGVRNVDPLTGQRMSEVNPNSIEEMEVITAGAGVEFGRAQGGFANIVQKQGSNEHEGVFEFYLRTSKLDGDGAHDFNNTEDAEFDSYQPSIHLSGPILRDKLWYSLSQQYIHEDTPRNITTEVVVVPERAWSNADKITWQVSPRNKLSFQLQSDPYKVDYQGVDRASPPETTNSLERETDIYTMIWTAPYSPKILVESTVAWQDLNIKLLPTEPGVNNDCVTGEQPFLAEAQCTNFQTGEVSGSFPFVYEDQRQRLTAYGKATIFAGQFLGGNHTFKVGFGVENERYFRSQETGPIVGYIVQSVPPEDGSEEEDPNPLVQAITNVYVPPYDEARVTGTNWGLYGEDEFKPRQNVTVRLGLRIDREEINAEGRQIVQAQEELNAFQTAWDAGGSVPPSWTDYFTGYEGLPAFKREIQRLLCEGVPAEEVGNCETLALQAINDQTLDDTKYLRRAEDREIYNTNFAPRLAVSWSPWSNNKTAFKAAAGRYYNLTPLTLPLLELDPDQATIVFDNRGCEPGEECVLDPSSGITPSVTVNPLDPDYATAYQDEITFAVDRELWAETSISFEYVNRRYRDQAQDVNVNLATGDYGTCVYQTNPASAANLHPWIDESPGSGQEVEDPLTGEIFVDTDPGLGDGRLDDCVGKILTFQSQVKGGGPSNDESNFVDLQRPDGRTDLYVQNPLWSDIYVIGNNNSIDYEAYTVRIVRRQYRSWEGNVSYTWSEAIGDGEDFNQGLGDDPSLDDAIYGYQSYDIRHQVKLVGSTITPWGIRLGTFVTWQSGLPYSILLGQRSQDSLPISTLEDGPLANPATRQRQWFPTGVRNDQRNPSYWNVDLRASKEINLSRGLNMQVSAEIFNLLNDGTYFVYNLDTESGFQFNGNDASSGYRFGRQWQLGMKLSW